MQAGKTANFKSFGDTIDVEWDSEVEFEGDYEDDEFVVSESDDVLHGKRGGKACAFPCATSPISTNLPNPDLANSGQTGLSPISSTS